MRRSAAAGAALLLSVQVAAAQVTYEGSLSGSTGTYLFTERTTGLVLTTGFSFRTGPVTLRASLPLWYQNTTLVTSSGAGSIPTGGPYGQEMVRDSGQARRQHGRGGAAGPNGEGGGRSGEAAAGLVTEPLFSKGTIPPPEEALTGYRLMMADPILTGTVRAVQSRRLALSAGAAIKVPIADPATIGTGQWDVGGQASLSFLMGRRWTVGLDAAYWHLGDLDSLDLEDSWLGSLSAGTLIGEAWGAMVSVAAGTSMLAGFDPPVSITLALTRFGSPGSWGINVGAGLTETAPDLSLGATWWVRL